MLTDANRAAAGLDAWVVPDMAKSLSFDPKKLQRALEANYPSVGESDQIQWGKPQWVTGDNRALRYRGNNLKREKMWFQIKNPITSRSFLRYVYTGWQWRVLPATSSIDQAPELLPVVSELNKWTAKQGDYPMPNHFIITRYRDGDHNIGAHYDKPDSIAPSSLIVVIKLGDVGRPFKLEWLDGTVIFDKVLPPGTGVVMTLEANLKTKHSVPVCETSGNSGSLVARTITDKHKVGWDEAATRIAKADEAANKLLGKRQR